MSKKMDKILAEISAGELIDKITILEIKKEKISNKEKFIANNNSISDYKNKLKDINIKLWDVENGKRAAEKKQDFGQEFISLARNVYKLNDERAKIKLAINNMLGSNIKEVKSHE